MVVELYPPGLNHAELHKGTGDMPLVLGTLAVPLEIATADQYGYGIFLKGTAVSGLLTGVRYDVLIGATGALNAIAIRARAAISGAYISTGYMYGIFLELEILGTAQIGQAPNDVRGLAIEAYQVAGTTIHNNVMAIYVQNYMLGTISGSYFMMWLQENGDVTLQAWMHFHQGGTSNANYFISLAGTSDAWASGGIKTGSPAGWLKVLTGAGDRWVQLYQ